VKPPASTNRLKDEGSKPESADLLFLEVGKKNKKARKNTSITRDPFSHIGIPDFSFAGSSERGSSAGYLILLIYYFLYRACDGGNNSPMNFRATEPC